MNPVVVESSAELGAPPALVWEVITDWERQCDWMLEMSEIVVTSERRSGVGVTARATIRIGGIRTTDIVRVDVWEPCKHLGMAHEGWVKGRGDIRLHALAKDRTMLDWREELQPPWGILGAIGLRVFRPLIRRTFARDVATLRNIVRNEASRRYSGNTDAHP
jgi:uncharacterized membrane protein